MLFVSLVLYFSLSPLNYICRRVACVPPSSSFEKQHLHNCWLPFLRLLQIKMKGPWKKFGYAANKWKHMGMIAGGTGLAPMYQLILEALNSEGDDTKITLLYANKSEADILLKERLDKLAAQHPSRFNVVYSLDDTPSGWKGEKGFVSKAMVQEHMPAPADGTRIFVCGPPGMVNHVSGAKSPDKKQGPLSGVLLDCGYTADNVFKY